MKRLGPGFSFTEIMVALGLMVLLGTIAVPSYLGYKQDSILNQMIENASAVKNKIDMCFRYAELHDCVGDCSLNTRLEARWNACTKKPSSPLPISDTKRAAEAMVQLGLIPCLGSGGAMSVSSACDKVEVVGKVLCITSEYKKQQGCVRYDANTKEFTVCVNPPEDKTKVPKDENPINLNCNKTGCDLKKGYKCDGTPDCICA